jgi:hypothetical protein
MDGEQELRASMAAGNKAKLTNFNEGCGFMGFGGGEIIGRRGSDSPGGSHRQCLFS